jgi:hypothetical protein
VITKTKPTTTTASAYLPEVLIFDCDAIETPTSKAEDNAFILSLIEKQHRDMGYGPVSSVFSSFLAAESLQAA